MVVTRSRLLTACGAILMAFAIGGCDSEGISPTPTTILINTPIPTPIHTVAQTPTLTLTPIPTPTPFNTPVLGPSTFTGTYMVDKRPSDIDFLNLVQTGNTVRGYLIIITPNASVNGSIPTASGSTKSTTISLTGTADGNAFYLSKTTLLNNWEFTGRREGNQVILSYPSQSGQIGSRIMTPASQQEFNSLLYDWQGTLSHRGGPYLGVSTRPIDSLLANLYDLKDENGSLLEYGVWIESVVPGSAAEEAGLQLGDVILSIDDVILDADRSLAYVLSDYLLIQPGDTVTLTLMRKGKRVELQATLGARP